MEFEDSGTLRDLHRHVSSRIRREYGPWCKRLGWSDSQICDWLEQSCMDGIMTARKDLDQWDPQRASLHFWCYLKARVFARDRLRKAQKQSFLMMDADPDLVTYADSCDPFGEIFECYEEKLALSWLKPEQQEVLGLYYLYGMEVQQIARVLDCKEKTVYTLLGRAREKARENLEQIRAEQKGPDLDRCQETRPPPNGMTINFFRLSGVRRDG